MPQIYSSSRSRHTHLLVHISEGLKSFPKMHKKKAAFTKNNVMETGLDEHEIESIKSFVEENLSSSRYVLFQTSTGRFFRTVGTLIP